MMSNAGRDADEARKSPFPPANERDCRWCGSAAWDALREQCPTCGLVGFCENCGEKLATYHSGAGYCPPCQDVRLELIDLINGTGYTFNGTG